MRLTTNKLHRRLELLKQSANHQLLTCNLKGMEREALRVTQDGLISQQSHPEKLGAAFTHPQITTDYSEALLEFISEPFPSSKSMLKQLKSIHQYTNANLPEGECIWPSSMPCKVNEDKDIPIAQFGTSNAGMMKTIYRRGLGHRYGRKMQAIAGIHFNFSTPDALWSLMRNSDRCSDDLHLYRSSQYMGLVRNFRRQFWLLLYLFGASPATDKSFVSGRKHHLEKLNEQDLYLPYATSLRMGGLGYQSSAQDSLYVCYNNIDSYVHSLNEALLSPYSPYEAISGLGIGQHKQQLSDAVLQIENEFYSTIRPKQTARSGETQLKALLTRGVEYIEVRCVDISPYNPLGINQEQCQFLEVFLMTCLLENSPDTTKSEYREVLDNQKMVVNEGRKPGLMLKQNGNHISLKQWSKDLFKKMQPVADVLDSICEEKSYSSALNNMHKLVDNPDLCPSAKLLANLTNQKMSFVDWSLEQAEKHRQWFESEPVDNDAELELIRLQSASLDQQRVIEAAQNQPLEQYIQEYFDQYKKL